MTLLITMDEALAHLRCDADPDVERKVAEASSIVLDYVTAEDKADWDEATAPAVIRAATKLVLSTLYDDRAADPLSPAVKNVLRRFRHPSMA